MRIRRRATWTEARLAERVATFTRHRAYEVRGAVVRLLPVGLARKRHFSRKYPIEVVMRRGDEELPAVEVIAAMASTLTVTVQTTGGDEQMVLEGETADGLGERNFGEAIMFSNVSFC